ncbi:MAG: LrgB family protein [Lachnospiraceae bacterium]|nr:LrgB family protein [Lachnospiraceae bacterium]
MSEFMQNSVFWGVALSFAAYGIGMMLQKKFRLAIFNPLLISVILIMIFLTVSKTDYRIYQQGAEVISYFLTPATVCLAIPLYEQMELLKKNFKAILLGILSGVLTSLFSVFAMAIFFGLDHKEYATLLPKSITTAIGMGVSEELGGYVTLTVAIIIITGILGSILAEAACRIFGITQPVAKGVAIGTASHAIGTSKAMEMGETEGAISGLSIAVAGLVTVAGASVFAGFL